MTIRERIAAYKAAVGPTASDVLRYPLTDAEGFELATELGASNVRFPDAITAAAAKLPQGPAPEKDDELVAWALKRKAAADAFWDAFEGEEVDGVTIIRRRA